MAWLHPHRFLRLVITVTSAITSLIAITVLCKMWPALQPDIDRTLAALAIILSVIAIVLENRLHKEFADQKAVFQEHKAIFKKHSEEFKEQRYKIEEIVSSVTTRYLGDWPNNLRPITDLLSGAKSSEKLVILVDIIGYGSYTRSDLYRAYLRAVCDAKQISGANVKISACNEINARKGLVAEFPEDDDVFTSPQRLETYLSSHRLSQKYIDFYQISPRYIERLVSLPKITYEDALNIHLFVEDTLYQQLRNCGIEVRIRSGPWIEEQVFFWMIENKEMIFAFPRFHGVKHGYSFKTRDDRLMAIFRRQFGQKWEESFATHKTYLCPDAVARIQDICG